jgi:hypothetical protein
MNYGDLLQSAYSAANNAANAENARLGPEASRGFDCGFAWVDIETPRGAKIAERRAALASPRGNSGPRPMPQHSPYPSTMPGPQPSPWSSGMPALKRHRPASV